MGRRTGTRTCACWIACGSFLPRRLKARLAPRACYCESARLSRFLTVLLPVFRRSSGRSWRRLLRSGFRLRQVGLRTGRRDRRALRRPVPCGCASGRARRRRGAGRSLFHAPASGKRPDHTVLAVWQLPLLALRILDNIDGNGFFGRQQSGRIVAYYPKLQDTFLLRDNDRALGVCGSYARRECRVEIEDPHQ